MLESLNKNLQLIPSNHGLFLLKVITHEGVDSILLTVDELSDLKVFLNDLPLGVLENRTKSTSV